MALRELSIPERAAHAPRFFKAGPGEYGEGDRFIGNKVPDQRAVAKALWKKMNWDDLVSGLHSEWHEVRLTTIFMLYIRYTKASKEPEVRQRCVDIYLSNLEGINNWDLVDSSAPYILGDWLLDKDRGILYRFADSGDLWKQRISMVTTYWFIKHHQYEDTLALAEKLLFHSHDLIHKAVGWMLREMGKKQEDLLIVFLEKHAHHMPRTALRYAIEKLDKDECQYWMSARDRA